MDYSCRVEMTSRSFRVNVAPIRTLITLYAYLFNIPNIIAKNVRQSAVELFYNSHRRIIRCASTTYSPARGRRGRHTALIPIKTMADLVHIWPIRTNTCLGIFSVLRTFQVLDYFFKYLFDSAGVFQGETEGVRVIMKMTVEGKRGWEQL